MAEAGLTCLIAFKTASPFSLSLSGVNETLPIGADRFPLLSTLKSILPALTALTAEAVSSVTVTVYGFGINPRGPRNLPSFLTSPIASGVATATSKS